MALDTHIINELLLQGGGQHGVRDLNSAYAFCLGIATSHYENFPVASRILRTDVRPHIAAVYSFARLADDISDESVVPAAEKTIRLQALLDWLDDSDSTTHPVVRAMRHTMSECKLPAELPRRLVHAFSMDADFRQPQTWDDNLHYCTYSANPIGETILRIHGIHDAAAIELSDRICSALQLINFWQDQSVDHPRGRCYLPAKECTEHGLRFDGASLSVVKEGMATEGSLGRHLPNDTTFDSRVNTFYDSLYARTRLLMNSGVPLLDHIRDLRLKAELIMIIESALRVLEKCASLHEEILHKRPSLGAADVPVILMRSARLFFAKNTLHA
jgi:squalene synthase HpnC